MAEQLCLCKAVRQCAAIDRHKRAFAATFSVQVARHQFFASTCVTGDEHCHIGGRELFDLLQQLL